VTGEKSGQAGWPGSSEVGSKGLMRRQNSPVPLAVFAHRQMRMRDLAARGDKKLLRAGSSSSGWFRAWANRSYPEGIRLLLRISTDGRLWRSRKKTGIRQKKDAERRDKMSVRTGKDTTARQAA
jgi:hypothetical protein